MRRTLLLVLLLALAGCGGGDDDAAQAPAGGGGVTDLENVLALRSDFEAASGKTRLLVLFSPT